MRSPPALDGRVRTRLREQLSAWYAANARDLPWRRTRDPYAVWISEAMLQQTRVEAVREAYGRFLARFPTARHLAAAAEEDVLAAWSGLGYYRRARALREAARILVREHGGRFPDDLEAALALPGVGRYTAGAVLSIGYDRPVPLVDGNVERVLCRLFELDAPSGSPELARECWRLAAELVPRSGAGAWNQALMELGATVCTPRAPRCLLCPVRGSCGARRSGLADALPRPKRRPRAVDVRLELAVAERRGRWLLERLPAGGRMALLWQFPTIERANPAGELAGLFPPEWPPGLRLAVAGELFELRHAITRHRILAVVRRAAAEGPLPDGWRWTAPEDCAALPLTGMARKVLRGLRLRANGGE